MTILLHIPNNTVFGASTETIWEYCLNDYIMAFRYDRLDALVDKYQLILKLESTIPGVPVEDVEVKYTYWGRSLNSFTLNADKPTATIDFTIDNLPMGEMIPLGYSANDMSYVTCKLENKYLLKNTRVYAKVQRVYSGYNYVDGISTELYIGKYGTQHTGNSLELNITDADLYDYAIGYTSTAYYEDDGIYADITHRVIYDGILMMNGTITKDGLSQGFIPIDFIKGGSHILRLETEINVVDRFAFGELRVYKKPKTFNASIATSYTYIGDNTPIPISITSKGVDNFTLQIYNSATNQVLHSAPINNHPSLIYLNLSDEGNIPLTVRILSSTNRVAMVGNTVTVNKYNILDRALTNIYAQNGLDKFVVINDVNRYFEDNAANRAIVQQIKAKGQATYLIYNDVSSVLLPLLES